MVTRPLIGILSQPGDGDGGLIIKRKGWKASDVSYIAASYVKFVEMGGARAVPLIYNEPEDMLHRKFSAINGILFPGGSASLQGGPFYETAEKLFKMALEENDKGEYFPIFGTCLGFELLSVIISQDHDVLERFSAKAQPAPLYFANNQSKQRNMFKWFPARVLEKLSTECLAMENHQLGISPQKLAANGALSSFFRVLTTSPDKNNECTLQGTFSVREQSYSFMALAERLPTCTSRPTFWIIGLLHKISSCCTAVEHMASLAGTVTPSASASL